MIDYHVATQKNEIAKQISHSCLGMYGKLKGKDMKSKKAKG